MALTNKIALVTGAAGGIGQAIARILARDGASVVAADLNLDSTKLAIQQLNGNKHFAVECNVTDAVSVKNCFQSVIGHYGHPPTLLAQAAGITRDNFLNKIKENDFADVINVNLKGTYLVQKEFIECLENTEYAKSSAVVNISSIVAKHGNMGQSNYAASKAAVEAFTKSTAKELGKKGIRVNCVVPGFIETVMVEAIPEHLKSMILYATPLKRMGKPEEVGEVVAFLLSDRCSFVTGALYEVTGGLSL